MARVKIKTKQVEKLVRNTLLKTSKQKDLYKEIANFIRDRIVAFARSGKNMKLSKRLPALSKSYRDYRQGKTHFRTSPIGHVYPIQGKDPDFPTTGEFFKASRQKSNLTLTGQLLDSLKVSSDGRFINIDSGRDDGKTNLQILKYLKELNKDYDFLPKNFADLDDKTQKRVKRIALDEFRRQIKKVGLK